MKRRLAACCMTVAAAILITGCATTSIEKISNCSNPDAGYWISCVTGNAKMRNIYAAKIAAREYAGRSKTQLPATLGALKKYDGLLRAPVQVRASLSSRDPDLKGLPPQEIERLNDYIASHEKSRSFNGHEFMEEWVRELDRISALMPRLEGTLLKTVRDGDQHLAKNDITGAEAALRDARAMDDASPAVLALEERIVVAKAKGSLVPVAAAIRAGLLVKAGSLQKVFGTPQSDESNLKKCMEALDEAETKIRQFRQSMQTANGKQVVSDDLEAAMSAIETEIASLLGRAWGEKIRLLEGKKQYWQCCDFTRRCFEAVAGMAECRKPLLNEALGKSYLKMLVPGLAFYVGEANDHFARDAYGITAVLCRMGEEMIRLAREREMRLPEEVLVWEKRCAESKGDAQKKIVSGLQRKLVIGEFTPAGRESEKLAALVYERCAGLLSGASTNEAAAAWGVTVERKAESVGREDYLIHCHVQELLVLELPPQEIERAVVKVCRDIVEIPNPQYNPETNKKAPKTVFSQDVFLYQIVRRRHERKVRLSLNLTCAHNGRKSVLASLDTDFSEVPDALKGIVMSDIEEDLNTPFLGSPKVSHLRNELVVDPWPKAVPTRLSSETEILNAVETYAAEVIAQSAVCVVSRFPVDSLAADAEKQGKLGKKYESADMWGRCLEYCAQLVARSGDSAGGSKAPDEQMRARLADLSTSYWKGCNPELVKGMPNVWSQAVQSVLALQQETR